MPEPKQTRNEPRRPQGTSDKPERSHERAPDDPGRGQGDVLDDQIPHHPTSDERTPRRD